jgi:hypothetical protein
MKCLSISTHTEWYQAHTDQQSECNNHSTQQEHTWLKNDEIVNSIDRVALIVVVLVW